MVKLTYTNPQDIPDKKTTEPTIHDKYKYLIDYALSGNIEGKWNIDSVCEIKRWMEKRVGRSLPIEWNCNDCIISLLLQFNKLK